MSTNSHYRLIYCPVEILVGLYSSKNALAIHFVEIKFSISEAKSFYVPFAILKPQTSILVSVTRPLNRSLDCLIEG